MQAVRVLMSESVRNYFAEMDDGSYRWVSDTGLLLEGGPAPAWVRSRLKLNTAKGEPNIREPPGAGALLATLNGNQQSPEPDERIDEMRPLVSARAAALGLSAYRISQLCDGKPNEETVARYLSGRVSANSANLSRILRALGWDGNLGWTESPDPGA